MDTALVRKIWQRARHCCECCRMPQEYDDTLFEIDHIIAKKHRGRTIDSNLSLIDTFGCDRFKVD